MHLRDDALGADKEHPYHTESGSAAVVDEETMAALQLAWENSAAEGQVCERGLEATMS